MPSDNHHWIEYRLTSIPHSAGALSLYELRKTDGGLLPAFSAGDYIYLRLPDARVWEFSITNAPSEHDHYIVGARYEGNDRNMTQIDHASLKAGITLEGSAPRESFHLSDSASHHMFIAVGAGINSLWALAQQAKARGLSTTLHYSCSSRSTAPFLDRMEEFGPQGHLYVSDDPTGPQFDAAAVAKAAPDGTQFYCCAPADTLYYLDMTTSIVPSKHLQAECCRPRVIASVSGGFTLDLARSGKSIVVPEDHTILEALEATGMWVPNSCRRGTCGACMTNVLDGTPDHRDLVLSDSERESGDMMLICCSGSRSDRLILDL